MLNKFVNFMSHQAQTAKSSQGKQEEKTFKIVLNT